jgi:hypothetical protein
VVAYDAEGRPITDQAEGQQPPPRPAVELSLAIDAREETPLQHGNLAATASLVTPPGTPGVAGASGISTWVARLTGQTTLEVITRRGGFDGRQTAIVRLRIPEARQIHASYLFSDWWTRPAFPRQMADVPTRTQFLLWERTDGLFCCLIPLVNGDLRGSLQGAAASAGPHPSAPISTSTGVSSAVPAAGDFAAGDLDIVVATEKSGLSSFTGVLFVLGTGPDPYSLVEAVYTRALQTLNLCEAAAEPVGSAAGVPVHVARGRRDKRFPDVLEYLGWCSWDAFYQQVNAAGLLEKAREFRSLQLPVKWVLIDDGWSPVQNRLLAGFDSDRGKFPAGLASVIHQLKAGLGIGWVGVWHALTGYWGGVDATTPGIAEVADHIGRTSAGTTVPAFTPEAAFAFYHAWHSQLQQQGVDFLKVDNQGAVYRHARESIPIPRAAAAWQYGLQASAGLHFEGQLLNCMAMSYDVAWFWNASNVARSSDDFFPNREGSAREHALQNIYNSLWLGELAWPDWDMWWTEHPQARYHQALRAISGGPVYVSDPLGKTDPELLWPLIFGDGRVLRCDQPARPTRDTLFGEPAAFKAFNRVGSSGILGVFWAGEGDGSVKATVSITDVEGLGGPASQGEQEEIRERGQGEVEWNAQGQFNRAGMVAGAGTPLFVLHEYYTGRRQLVSPGDQLEVMLKPWEARVYCFVPVRSIAYPISLAFAPVGLVNKIISPRAVLECKVQLLRTAPDGQREVTSPAIPRLRGSVILYEGGHFLAYCDRKPLAVEVTSARAGMGGSPESNGRAGGQPVSWDWANGWLDVKIPGGLVRPAIEIFW